MTISQQRIIDYVFSCKKSGLFPSVSTAEHPVLQTFDEENIIEMAQCSPCVSA